MTAFAADVTFQWPAMLWLLALIPLAVAYYAKLARHRRREAARFASLELAGGAQAQGAAGAIGRALPPLLMLLALAAFLLAVARPQASLSLPATARTVILAMDASGSMRAGDLKPDRIAAAREAAKAFIEAQPPDAKVGIVSIAATASVTQSPTTKREDLREALERFQLQRGTALGSGIVIALATLLPEAGIDVERHISEGRTRASPSAAKPPVAPVEPGSNASVAIVLLSDGQSNVGPDPLKMARLAAEHGVRVYTVGIGTTEGTTLTSKGWSMRVRLDEAALKGIAEATRGEYFQASSASEMTRVYRALSARLTMEKRRPMEVSALLAGFGILLAGIAAFTALLRDGRIL